MAVTGVSNIAGAETTQTTQTTEEPSKKRKKGRKEEVNAPTVFTEQSAQSKKTETEEPKRAGTGHSKQLDIKREAYQQAQLELSKKEMEYTGKTGTVNYVEGSDILVKNIDPMGSGLTYVSQLNTLLAKLSQAKEDALKEESNIEEETRQYLNDHLDITDFENDTGYKAIKAKALAVQARIDAIDKNISLVTETYLNPANTELAELKAAKETAEQELEKAKKEANSAGAHIEARYKAYVEKREADKTAKADYNAAVQKAEDKKEANRIAIEQGAEPTPENEEQYVKDVHNAFVAKEHAEAFQTMALNELRNKFGSQLQDVNPIDLTIEAQLTTKVTELKASVIEKNNDAAVKMKQFKNHEIEESVLKKAEEEAEQLRKDLQTAQTLLANVTKFLDTEHEFKLADGTTSTQTYRAAIGGVAAADEAYRKAQETAYQQLEQTYNQEIQKATDAKNEALDTNKDYRRALRTQIRMLTPEVFNHVNKTKEEAIKYGKDIVARYAEDVQDKIVVDAKEVTDKKGHKSYVAVYKDLNGNEIKDFKAFLLSDKKDLPTKIDSEIEKEFPDLKDLTLNSGETIKVVEQNGERVAVLTTSDGTTITGIEEILKVKRPVNNALPLQPENKDKTDELPPELQNLKLNDGETITVEEQDGERVAVLTTSDGKKIKGKEEILKARQEKEDKADELPWQLQRLKFYDGDTITMEEQDGKRVAVLTTYFGIRIIGIEEILKVRQEKEDQTDWLSPEMIAQGYRLVLKDKPDGSKKERVLLTPKGTEIRGGEEIAEEMFRVLYEENAEKDETPAASGNQAAASRTQTAAGRTQTATGRTQTAASRTQTATSGTQTAGDKTTEVATVYVHNGDTLKKIAARFGVSEDEIKKLNPHIFSQHKDCGDKTIKYLVAGKPINLPAGVDKAKVESDQAQFNPQKIKEQYIAKVTSTAFLEKNKECYRNIKAAGPASQKALFKMFNTFNKTKDEIIAAGWDEQAVTDWEDWKAKQQQKK